MLSTMAAKFASTAEEELACGVCFHFFVTPHEPKNLPRCSHILCKVCLQKMTEGGQKTIKCPHCNEVSPLTTNGVDGLTTSLALRNLAERHPEGIKQYKEYTQSQFHNGQDENAQKVTKLKELIKQTQQAIQVEENEIEKTVEAVMEKAKGLIQQLRNTSGLDQLLEQLAKLETGMKNTNTPKSKLETMTDAQTDAALNQIEKMKIGKVKKITSYPCVGKFFANVQLGIIVKPKQLELVQEFGEFKWACGISTNSTGVLAVCDWKAESQQVYIFQKDNKEYRQQSRFSVHPWPEVKPLRIVLSEEGKYMVTKCVPGFDVYSTLGKFQKTESVIDKQSGLKKTDVQSVSICTTKNGKILVGSIVQGGNEKTRKYILTVHDKGASLVNTIPIGIQPSRITDINGTRVAVSDYQGNKVRAYNLHTGKETLSIDVQMPRGICYDEQSDCLLIGRMTDRDEHWEAVLGSGVIDQYCMISGELVACLAQGLLSPGGLTITEDNMLAVVDVNTVKLYEMD